MALLYGRAGRLTAKNGGFRPGQTDRWCGSLNCEPACDVNGQCVVAGPGRGNLTCDCRPGFWGTGVTCLPATACVGGVTFEQLVHTRTVDTVCAAVTVCGREQQIGGSGGSLEPPGPLLTHLHTVHMV